MNGAGGGARPGLDAGMHLSRNDRDAARGFLQRPQGKLVQAGQAFYARGFFGWVFLLIFLGFNALMLAWLIAYWNLLSEGVSSADTARAAGTAIGGTIGTGMLLVVWVLGSVITGILALLTRGRKTIITETVQS